MTWTVSSRAQNRPAAEQMACLHPAALHKRTGSACAGLRTGLASADQPEAGDGSRELRTTGDSLSIDRCRAVPVALLGTDWLTAMDLPASAHR